MNPINKEQGIWRFCIRIDSIFCIKQQPPSDLTVSLGGLFFAFPEQIFFVAVHLVLFFFGQALALFAGFVRGVDVGQAQKVVGGGAVELAMAISISWFGELFSCSQLRMVEVATLRALASSPCVWLFQSRKSANRAPIILFPPFFAISIDASYHFWQKAPRILLIYFESDKILVSIGWKC